MVFNDASLLVEGLLKLCWQGTFPVIINLLKWCFGKRLSFGIIATGSALKEGDGSCVTFFFGTQQLSISASSKERVSSSVPTDEFFIKSSLVL